MFESPVSYRHAFVSLLIALLCATGAGCSPSDPLELIRQRQAIGDLEGTIEPLRELLEERRDDPEIYFLYGRALAFTGRPSLAEWSLRAAMEDAEWRLPAGSLLAFGALQTGNWHEAVEIASLLIEEHPENVELLLMRANANVHLKLDREAALADVDRVLELDPDNVEALEPRILALLGLERAEEAAEAIDELGRRIDAGDLGEGMTGWHCATTAIFADESGERELAEERWNRCLDLYPAHDNVVGNAVDFFDSRREFDHSLEILRRAQTAQPASTVFRLALVGRLQGLGENAEAEVLLRAATEDAVPEVAAAAWIDLGKFQQSFEDFSAAAQSVGEAFAIAREGEFVSPQLLFEYADALLLAGEYEAAREITDEMKTPAHQAMIRARVAQERGRPVEALEYFDEAFLLWPDNPWARYMAALAAEAVGDFDRAISLYRYAIRISVGATDARFRAARILLAEGKAEEAELMLRVKSGEVPVDLEGELLSVRAWGAAGRVRDLGRTLEVFVRHFPHAFGRALAQAAEGTAAHSGAEAAEAALRQWEANGRVDFSKPELSDALRALVRYAAAAGRGAGAEATARTALRAQPMLATYHEILGLALELRGAPADETRAAYARALELETENARALAGLGRLALPDSPDAALAYFDRALAADPALAESELDAAKALVALGREAAAEERLARLLERDPTAADAAAALADIHLARGLASERTLELAGRAVRFGGGPEALDRLARVHRQRGEPEPAAEADGRAQGLRTQSDG